MRRIRRARPKILILDFGSQYTQLIARRVREASVYCEIHPHDVDDAFVREFAPKGVILSGSHASAYEGRRRARRRRCSSSACRCSASATACRPWRSSSAAGRRPGKVREFGYAEVRARGHTKLLEGIEDRATPQGPRPARGVDEPRRQGHRAAAGLQADGLHDACPIAGMADEARGFYGVQFHPEVTHTRRARAILERFVRDICGCNGDWNMPDYVEEAVARIREQVGARRSSSDCRAASIRRSPRR
jgi:GMP synthase (glutamine-hydrolysing)